VCGPLIFYIFLADIFVFPVFFSFFLHESTTATLQLNATLQERELRINQLSTKQLSEEDAQRLILLEATTRKLDMVNKKVTELEDKLTRLKTEWAQSAGNDQSLRESMQEMQDKHHKRWYELTSIWSTTSSVVAQSSTAVDDSNSSKNNGNGEPTASWQQQRQDESSNGDVANAVTSTADSGDGLEAAATSADEATALAAENQERTIMELQHKLSQALENVRQAETARNNLKTALSMNTTLQGKLDDLKHKYAAAVAAAAEQRSSSSSSSSANPSTNNSSSRSINNTSTDVSSTPSGGGGGGSSTPRERDSASSSTAAATTSSSTHSERPPHNQERADKLYRDNKKMKKEITAMMASKEAHKAKIERVEKERDGLMDANSRLLKQITENDEMNAKSLSTILHLKSMTEHLNAERDNLEQQVKSASQLALASRLASNAKERVSEEMLKEKNAIHERLTELETTHAATKEELNRITLEWSLADGKEATIRTELSIALQRCDELVSQVEEKRQEIRKLVAALDKAEQEARDAKRKLAESTAAAAAAGGNDTNSAHRRMSGVAAGTGDSGGSTFTVEQLNTQISFLKGRLACPVCHYRDKQCIIMRCRHMHCKQCVDDQISNRSRKCPSCNGKFSEKDVEDVFLD
jgi:E3 ubiquitin-protein ligase BRE1